MKTAAKKFSSEEMEKLRKIDFSKLDSFITHEEVMTKEVGAKGSPERLEFAAKARAWYYGEILRDKRKELGVTQKELAERIGRERAYISRIEQGETDIQLSTFIRIADALGINISLTTRLA